MEKRILIIDPLSYFGHVNYNNGIKRCLDENHEIGIVVNRKAAESLQQKGEDINNFVYLYPDEWNNSYLSKRMSKILCSGFIFYIFFKARNMAKNYDRILFTCIDVYALKFRSLF